MVQNMKAVNHMSGAFGAAIRTDVAASRGRDDVVMGIPAQEQYFDPSKCNPHLIASVSDTQSISHHSVIAETATVN